MVLELVPALRSRSRTGLTTIALGLVLAGCHAPTADPPGLRAASAASAVQVVEELLEAVGRADAHLQASRLCAAPQRRTAVRSLLAALVPRGGEDLTWRVEPSWVGQVPVFRVEIMGPAHAGGAGHQLVVRAREGCVSDVVQDAVDSIDGPTKARASAGRPSSDASGQSVEEHVRGSDDIDL